ncbi:hypothetical protein [Litchfieldia salsa]|uniref:Uncharacterized protein n=1 Tax=Litchfieldia salsa TaxID=930152 RepID=A0A1H0THL3_9BACI|nr:hypothetical protein [Litchfieldia salsa]SDP53321.1 hypothetical protein SAMN05216565_103520 [Litchfieldia salsa]
MLRHIINGFEVIIRSAHRLSLNHLEKEEVYRKVLSVGSELLDRKNDAQFILSDQSGSSIILDIKHGEIVVITIESIIDDQNCILIDG